MGLDGTPPAEIAATLGLERGEVARRSGEMVARLVEPSRARPRDKRRRRGTATASWLEVHPGWA